MKSNSITHIAIGNSLLWAAAMIASALVLLGSEQVEEVFLMLLILAVASFLMLQR